MPKTTELDIPAGEVLVRITPEQAQNAYKVLRGEIVPTFDPEVMANEIASRIEDADTDDEVDALFTPQEARKLPAWGELLMGVPVKIHGLPHFNPSAKKDNPSAPSVYIVVDLLRADTGEIVTVHTGARNVMMQVVKIVEKGLTDRLFRMVSDTATSGNSVYSLEYADVAE